MKKIFLFAALTSIVLASCQKEAPVASVAQNEGQQEVTFAAFSKAMTKGVLGSGTFATGRTIQVAGVMKTADGQYVDFLEAKTFARKGSDGATWQASKWDETSSAWVADPVYYPIGGTDDNFRFLAYSESSGDATFARWYGSKQVELQVYDCAENEIVYSGFKGNKTSTTGAQATFKRTQALVSVTVKTKDAIEYTSADNVSTNAIKINKIGFKDVKTSGALVLTIDPKKASTDATAEWIYNAGCNCSFADMGSKRIDGDIASTSNPGELGFVAVTPTEVPAGTTVTTATTKNAPGHYLDKNGFTLDRLFPAQTLEAKTMVINYTLGENTFDVELPLDGTSGHAANLTWKAGTHYTYKITVNVNEILINPQTLDAWEVTAASTEGQYDPDPVTP